MTNCPNCGAPVTGCECDYCGSHVRPRLEPNGKELWERWERLQRFQAQEDLYSRIDWVKQMQKQQLMEAAVCFPAPSLGRDSDGNVTGLLRRGGV